LIEIGDGTMTQSPPVSEEMESSENYQTVVKPADVLAEENLPLENDGRVTFSDEAGLDEAQAFREAEDLPEENLVEVFNPLGMDESPAEAEAAARASAPAQPLPPVQAAASAPQPRYVTLPTAVVMTAGGSLVSFFMASIFILALFGLINRGFQYARPQDINNMNGQLSALQVQSQEANSVLSGVQNRLSTVEGYSARIAELERDLILANARAQSAENQIASLQGSLNDASTRMDLLAKELDEADLKIDALITRSQRFQTFLNGLNDLLSGLNQLP
jgi:methyl-accepting chemotaxis protein